MKKREKVIFGSEDVTEGYTMFVKEIGLRLYILRMERELSATAVARALKINPIVFRQIEKGEFNWTVEVIKKIQDYYEVQPKKWDIFSRLLPHDTDAVFS